MLMIVGTLFDPSKYRRKVKVKRAVKRDLLDWAMHDKGLDAGLRNLAYHEYSLWYLVHQKGRSSRRPLSGCCERISCFVELSVWRRRCLCVEMLCAMNVESMLLSWMTPSESVGSDHSDNEYECGWDNLWIWMRWSWQLKPFLCLSCAATYSVIYFFQ